MKRKRSVALSSAVLVVGIAFYVSLQPTPTYSASLTDAAPATTSDTGSNLVTTLQSQIDNFKRQIQHIISGNKIVPTVAATPDNSTHTATPAIKGNSISIASIGFQAPIREVGVTADNAIDVPSGMQVGYWNGSATPGSPGAVFLDGHLQGIFARLTKVSAGQIIAINYGAQTYRYKVVHTEVVPLAGIDMDKALSTYGGASEGLNLMTCAGTYIASQGTYDHRFVVYAVKL